MIKFFKNKFDLIVSLGSDCACTSYLRRCNLQHNSYPFDWLTNAPFENRIELILNDFKDFLNFDDLKEMKKPDSIESDNGHKYYENTKNRLYFWHDFNSGIDLQEDYKNVKEKYDRRIKRFYEEIENSKKILFVWLSHKYQQDEDVVKNAHKKLSEKFQGKEIYLLLLENNNDKQSISFESEQILVIRYDTKSDDKKHHFDPTMGNKTNNLKVFKKLKINRTFLDKLKQIVYKIILIFVCLIPKKTFRQKLKSKINMYFYHAKL